MKSDVVMLSVDMELASSEMDRAIELLMSGVGRIEAKLGCRQCLISRDTMTDSHLHYSETWATDDDFKRHVASEEFRRILAAMDMSMEKPVVMIGNLSGHAGMNYLRKICGHHETEER